MYTQAQAFYVAPRNINFNLRECAGRKGKEAEVTKGAYVQNFKY